MDGALLQPPADRGPHPGPADQRVSLTASQEYKKKGAESPPCPSLFCGERRGITYAQRVAAVFFPCQAPGRAQRIEREHHFASVAAGERRHQLLEPLRAVGKGRFDGREAVAFKTRRLRDGRFDSARLYHRQSKFETRFRT